MLMASDFNVALHNCPAAAGGCKKQKEQYFAMG